MKNSIRTKLFWGISLLIIFFVLFSLFLNLNLLDKFHIFQKGRALYKEFLYIDKVYNGNPYQVQPRFEKLVHITGTNIVILDRNYVIKCAFFPRPPGLPREPLPSKRPNLPGPVFQTTDWSKPTYFVDRPRGRYRHRNIQFLNFTATLHNGEHLWMGTPLPEIRESVAISNRFFLLTGILTMIIGGLFSLLYSKKFTQPILELNKLAQNMVKLDFTRSYPVKTQDEIGELGRSINSLSEQLGKSIGELQLANQKLQLENERQKQIDETRKEFISNVSHELKTPIALIQGYSEGLKLNIIENESDKNFYCDVIMDEITKMNKLVRNLLDLSEIDSGYLQLDKEVFDLAQLTEAVLEKYQLILKDKGICLEFEKNSNAFVDADIYRIEQVLVNYINNALAHINGNKLLKVGVTVQNSRVKLIVFNSGNSIPKAALEKIWFSFYKVDKARTRANGGSGLGLSIVRAILEQHQGRFGADNRTDGVEFWFELPQVKQDLS
ncbi:MAG TPA: two-component sensor histidine kinase [Firmicutes bacterium]|nr:two-component sensor histidine kinase [Bacillota bacterium]